MTKLRGLAAASKAVRQRVAKKGGTAKHIQPRGLAAASQEVRQRVATMGGQERAKDPEGLAIAGKIGGDVVVQKYGREFFVEIGKKGGRRNVELYGAEQFAEMGRKGGQIMAEKHLDDGYFQKIGKKGAEARWNE